VEYIREYRTYFHISQSYSVSESTAYKTVRWIEDTLIKHPDLKAETLLFREKEKAHVEESSRCRQEESKETINSSPENESSMKMSLVV